MSDTSAVNNSTPAGELETLTLGAGCFWCLDAAARRTPGVVSSVTGFAGDHGPAPSEDDYRRGLNPQNFVEAVQVTYRPSEITFDDMMELFFASHDPTTPNRDGANIGDLYHSTLFYTSAEQRLQMSEYMDKLQARMDRKLVTSLRPFEVFYAAEEEHQDYYNRNRATPYCRVVIVPKLRKLGLSE
ncbi:peptide-methionine (S)-S-oxide reductase MsrA [Saccharothrix australiensis]|uniref:Peptide methionine sulfoxide reductase MsrA n=1 Tax=Saccharothrix australiensis TaxID=2072 RepID=A0A495VXE2_9PSEU|nr:peptide-methionine (S)-S-oxide reductase MsrA [Saccharothrix australiensis]RKT53864.1 peptide-methionine (S)-S-oxide reductase [Saccharothrix australiensis]